MGDFHFFKPEHGCKNRSHECRNGAITFSTRNLTFPCPLPSCLSPA
ncbi:hypothetical protein Nmel_000934 [Mimus melanotis]